MSYPDVQRLITKARQLQAQQESCERVGGHYYFGVGPSLIEHPEEYWEPGWVVRQVFAGKLDPEACYGSSWRCSRCGRRLSQREALEYIREKRKSSAYHLSHLWC